MVELIVKGDRLTIGEISYRCAYGKNGFSAQKREGDGATPSGRFPLRYGYIRTDKVITPATGLPLRQTTSELGWCDDPNHKLYNRPVNLPFDASHEKLYREDDVYDVVIVLGYNDNPPVAPLGSAIFFHIARPDYSGTEGCIAVSLPDMLDILPQLTDDDWMEINPEG